MSGSDVVTTHILGIRHHGPGSARAVRAELDRLAPDAVLIEGPADASAHIPMSVADGMAPPVALLGYVAADPRRAAFWPFGVFSPEWQAMTWAVKHGVHVEFCDLPTTMSLAPEPAEETVGADDDAPDTDPSGPGDYLRRDPIALLARAADYDDPERWWDDVVETRSGGGGFDAITEAMTMLRERVGDTIGDAARDERREAYMRQCLRKAMKREGVQRIAVVCGAWHAPALVGRLGPAAADARLLTGTPKVKTSVAWVPWTHSRLAVSSGYGAGVVSPGWYHHLFVTTDDVVIRWLTDVANLLRANDISVSSAHIIETARLASTLAVLRRRPLAGLEEIREATLAVLCDGRPELLALVERDAVVGEKLGSVPDDAPIVPLQADLTATARSVRLKFDPASKELVLDLRRPADIGKSHLLHRLRVLGIDWGTTQAVRGTGTFKEGWVISWQPDFAVDVVLASVWGTTVEQATVAKLVDAAATASTLADITTALERALLAAASGAVNDIISALHDRAALDRDVAHLMEALPALGRARRYGDVRGTDTAALATVASGLLVRVCVGLPSAVTSLDETAASELKLLVDGVQDTVGLLDAEDRDRWYAALSSVSRRSDVNGILLGRIVRLLLDAGVITSDDAALRLTRALSAGATPMEKARWVEGFLGDSGILLVHDRALLGVVDEWLSGLREQDFTDVLPLLRRTFGLFDAGVRRNIADRLRSGAEGRAPQRTSMFDAELVAPALATMARILELPHVG
ncbi:DUF5682 family protein [Gordonia asplenii]|uniref:DUF5682 family protein n=1 Tax=Gordonia asplenii TaxID=2725283 RepID=UPI0028AE46DE|nr:DUF5682 family protein [Gordonia asplenii]